jgi:hypothetical protein
VVVDRLKLIDLPVPELYDLDADPGERGLEEVRVSVGLPPTGRGHVGAGQHVAVVVEHDLGREPRRLGVRPDQDEEAA